MPSTKFNPLFETAASKGVDRSVTCTDVVAADNVNGRLFCALVRVSASRTTCG